MQDHRRQAAGPAMALALLALVSALAVSASADFVVTLPAAQSGCGSWANQTFSFHFSLGGQSVDTMGTTPKVPIPSSRSPDSNRCC